MSRTRVPARRRASRAFLGLALLTASLLLTPAHRVSAQSWLWEIPQGLEAGFRWPGYAEGELLVKFRERLASDDRARAARDEGDVLEETITPDGLVKVRLGAGRSVVGSIDRWSARGDVEYATVNLRARGFFTPNDTVISTFDLGWNLRSVGAYDAWDVGTGDPSVVLAIIDSGVAFEDHEIPPYEREFVKPDVTMYRRSPDLPGPFLPGWDFVHDDGHPNDDNGHGTNVATVAAGAANNVAGSAGIAFGVTILPVKVLDYRNDSSMEWIVAGIRFAADHGAHIANLSLGFPPIGLFRLSGFPENVIAHMFKPLHDAVSYAQRRGTILVAASGNFNASEVSPPAAYPGVIAVGASNVDNRRSSYSSFGRALDFVAPGGDFTELNGDQVQDGVAVLSIKPHRSEGSLANPDSFNVFVFFGTSAAAPHVAGAVALLMSRGLTKQGAIEQTLRATAIHPFALKPGSDPEYGAGLIQIDAAMRDLVPAHGLNLARALDTSARPSVRLLSGNPARGGASLALRVLRPGPVRVRVFDVSGALVRSLLDGDAPAGERVLRWDGRTTGGAAAGSGIYFFRIETADGAVTRKVAFLR